MKRSKILLKSAGLALFLAAAVVDGTASAQPIRTVDAPAGGERVNTRVGGGGHGGGAFAGIGLKTALAALLGAGIGAGIYAAADSHKNSVSPGS